MAAKEEKKKGKPQKESGGDGGGVAAAVLTPEELAELKDYAPRLRVKYRQDILPAMMKRFGYKNVNQAPRLSKIVVNMGLGESTRDAKILESGVRDLTQITGQKPRVTKSRKSISAFKLRAGMSVGCFVTLRGNRMYEFLDRLINIAIPRIRDFRGFPARSFDGRGNHSIGVREHLIFMELDYNKVATVLGMNITTVTTAKTDEEALELLKLFGFPFREK
jgi:large subunit ribosomal protein L5